MAYWLTVSAFVKILEQKEKGPVPKNGAFSKIIPAATYVPTQLPVQYHRPGEA
jgi:hypothetical protein